MTSHTTGIGLSVTTSHADQPDPLIVLVHGALDRAGSFARSVRHLGGLPVLRYDRRGYGRSSCDDPVGLQDHVGDLLALIGDRIAVVVGHSFGGVIGLSAARWSPSRIMAVGAFEAPMMWRPWWPTATPGNSAVATARQGAGSAAAGETFMISLIGEERWLALPGKVRAARRDEGVALVAELSSIDPNDPPYDPAGLRLPILAGHGTLSKPYLIRAARTLADEAPLGECMVFEDADHGAHLSHPRQFAQFVLRAREMGLAHARSSI
ncbi:MAG: alpha/beta hydrolase [Actinobacteria bacterium]|nr:alpha/beta hydrolase [Actinomycetota bacterium]